MNKLVDGYTLMHEHITIDLSKIKNDQDCILDCELETIKELKQLYANGVRNIVDVTNDGMGNNTKYIKRVEEMTGINIIQSCGYYKEPFFPDIVENSTVEQLAEIILAQINVDKTFVIGEFGTSKNKWEVNERKVFDASIIAHKKTNAVIYTHTTLGTLAYEQALYFIENGVNPNKVVIGHVDLNNEFDYIKKVIDTGVFVGFDTIGKNAYLLDELRIEFLLKLQQLNLLKHVVLSMDLTRKSHLKYKGGIGYNYLFENFIPKALASGITQDNIDLMLRINPQIIFGDIND